MTLLEIEFPVAHPESPRFLWTYAVYDIEVPGDVGGLELQKLHAGRWVLVSGPLSERIGIEDGRTSRHPVVVATLLKLGTAVEKPR